MRLQREKIIKMRLNRSTVAKEIFSTIWNIVSHLISHRQSPQLKKPKTQNWKKYRTTGLEAKE